MENQSRAQVHHISTVEQLILLLWISIQRLLQGFAWIGRSLESGLWGVSVITPIMVMVLFISTLVVAGLVGQAKMENPSELIAIAATVAGCLIPAIWTLSMRISKHESKIDAGLSSVNSKLESIEKDLDFVREEIKVAREGRAQIWGEVNNLRERTTRLSTVIQLKDEKCQK